MKKPAARPRVPSIACPHCQHRTIARSSERITDTVREVRMHCDNDDCGAAFVVQLSVIRMIRPSQMPNPRVHLPLGIWCPKPANDDAPLPANDDAPAVTSQPAPMTG